MSCPSCGSPATPGSCPQCSKEPSDSWGSEFDSWGSSPAQWENKTPASSWQGLPAAADAGSAWGGIATAPAPPLAAESGPAGWGVAAALAASAPPAQENQPDGWGAGEPGIVSTSPAKSQIQVDIEECEDGWLGSPATAKVEDGPLSPVRGPAPRGVDEAEDSWLDNEDQEADDTPQFAPAPVSNGHHRWLWAVVAAGGLLLLIGFWSLRQPLAAPAVSKAAMSAQAAAESLQRGRLMAVEGKASLKKDAVLAASQLEAAIASLKAGGAGIPEIRQTRLLQAQALAASGDYEQANALYLELLKVPEYKVPAGKAIVTLKLKLIERADDLLEDAEGSLKAGQFRLAETQGQEALRLYQAFGGKASRKGMAYGAIGYANLNLGRVSLAWDNLSLAHQLYPQGNYHSVLMSLKGGSAEPEQPAPASPQTTVVVDSSAQEDLDYPTGGRVKVRKSAKTKTVSAAETTASTKSAKTESKQKTNTVTKTVKEVKRHRQNNSLDMTDRSQKS